MNDRQKRSQPLTKLDLAVRFMVVVSVSLFGIGLTLDADEAPQPATKDLPVITPRKVEAKTKQKTKLFDNSVFKRLSWSPRKTEPTKTVDRQRVEKTSGRKNSVAKKPIAKRPAAKHSFSMRPVGPKTGEKARKLPAKETATRETAESTPVWELDKTPHKKPAKTARPLAKKTAKRQPKSQDEKKPAQIAKKPAPWMLIPNAGRKTTTTQKTKPATRRPVATKSLTSTKTGKSTPLRQRLANLYAKVAPKKPSKKTTKKSTNVVKPVAHVNQPAAKTIKTAAVKQPETKSTARPFWDLSHIKKKSTTKRKTARSNPTEPVKIAKATPPKPAPVKTTPPVSKTKIPQPPITPKPSASSAESRPKPPVQRTLAKKQPKKTQPNEKSIRERLKLSSVVSKFFPAKSKRPSRNSSKTEVAKAESSRKPAAAPSTVFNAAKGHNKSIKKLPIDDKLAQNKSSKKPTDFSFAELKISKKRVEQVAASEDPVFDLQVIDDFDFSFLPPLVANRKQDSAVPPTPAEGDGNGDEPETLGYNGFKPISEVTVNINHVKEGGEDPPDLAGPEFADAEPIVLNTEWVDQRLTAPLLPFYHQPLYFEDPNAERCGETWGCLQPAASAGLFYLTIPALPYLIGAYPPDEEVESFGDCAYGCKYKLHEAYVPRFSLKGIALQGAVTTGLIYLIP